MWSQSQTEHDGAGDDREVGDVRVVGVTDVVDRVPDRSESADRRSDSLSVIGVCDIAASSSLAVDTE